MQDFAGMSFLLQAVLAFGGGVVAFLSPCVLPLVPGYLGLMSGYSVAELQSGSVSRRRMLKVTTLFVAGFSAVFVATGAVATSLAQFLNRNQQVIDRIAGAVVVAFAVVMIGTAFTGRGLFGFLARERRLEVRPSRLGALAPPVMGAAFGFGWTACIGPILAGLLALAGTQETVTRGMALLLVFSLGLGVPFVASALLLDKAFRATRIMRRWLRPIQVASGGVMLAFGVLLLTNQVSRLASLLVELFVRIPLLDRLAAI
ncbi:MAG: cytochrome C biogenesis protein CcdA [Acidimicrobiia bacterium]|nr:MAG: cytochrome C biogenesis protein CcdA [Acidimicrobiia bacterium]